MSDFKPCIIIPVYDHGSSIRDTILSLEQLGFPCFIVDDGSGVATKNILQQLARTFAWVEVLQLPANRGKGAAVCRGLLAAFALNFTHALQIDADGQHHAADAEHFLSAAKENPAAFVIGKPIFDRSAPKKRLWGRQLSRALVWLETISFDIDDVLCGYRLYPLQSTVQLLRERAFGERMDFDTEIAVRLHWAGVPVVNIRTPVRYPEGGISHFRMVRDNLLLVILHIRLLVGMAGRFPRLLHRHLGARRTANTEWHTIAERGSILGFRLMLFVHKILGRKVCAALLYPITAYFFLTGRSSRRASREYLARVYAMPGGAPKQKPTHRLSFRHLLQFAYTILDKVSVWAGNITLGDVVCDIAEEFKRLVDEKKGGVLLGAHLGNMEITRALSDKIPGLIVNTLMYVKHMKVFNSGIEQMNPQVGVRVLAIDTITVDTAVILKRRVEQGEFVALQGDRTAVGAPEKVVSAPFLGEVAMFPQGPFVLASLLECPVYLLFCFRESASRYRIYFEQFSDRLEFPRLRRRETLQAEIERFAKRLEHYCLKEPLQWFNFYDFWQLRNYQ